jgi:hypothetical protein
LNDAGKIVKEVKVVSEPQAPLKVRGNPAYCFGCGGRGMPKKKFGLRRDEFPRELPIGRALHKLLGHDHLPAADLVRAINPYNYAITGNLT